MTSIFRGFTPMRPDVLLRAEAFFVLFTSCWGIQHRYPHHWGLFALLFFLPDLSLLGYVIGQKEHAAAMYNLAHNYVLPLALALYGFAASYPEAGLVALTWLAHIAFDRMLGYRLKFPGLFKYTHIQRSESATN